ncbi:hypothetical protein BS78_02G203300 [Paspalum vaginatum]|nr:hypothetical protein BS78_02G203300 [Paspalum vaginatum]KAJ1289933.1 hypothetical protein BS78_02G203300 [Paspalum vaginatum]
MSIGEQATSPSSHHASLPASASSSSRIDMAPLHLPLTVHPSHQWPAYLPSFLFPHGCWSLSIIDGYIPFIIFVCAAMSN